MIRSHLTLLLTFLLAQSSFGQLSLKNESLSGLDLEARKKNPAKIALFRPSASERKDKARNLILDRNSLAWVWDTEPERFTTEIPLPGNKAETLSFIRNYISTESYVIETSDGRKLAGKEYAGIHYKLEGSGRIGGLSFREDGVMGIITHPSGAYNIGESTPGRGNYVVSNDGDIDLPNWTCDTEDNFEPVQTTKTTSDKAATASCKKVRIWFEADNDLYKKSANSVTTATNFVNGMFNVISQIYANEQITIQLSGVFVWTTVDPYALITSPGTILLNFATNRIVSLINGDLTHLISTRATGMGGIAYTGVLCNPTARHGFSNIYYNYSALPTYSWSVGCIAHEIGHNFGSKHTHWCGWDLPNGTKGRIDSCASGEAFNGVSCGNNQKARKGTIMSYCHITLGGIDFNLGFGPLPGNAIRNGLANAACISGTSCLGVASIRVDSTNNLDKNYRLTITIPANHNATSWRLLEGTVQLQSGTLANQNASTLTIPISGKANGTYNYTVTLTSATGTSSTSTAVEVVVAVPSPPPVTGNCIANGLQAWFDATGKVNFRYNLSTTCNTYVVNMCRYNLTNPNVIPTGSETPAACSVRNGMSNYTPTTTEKTLGFLERVANPQPGNMTGSPAGSYWYSIDVTCRGSQCTTGNRTRTYIFVPGQ